MRVSTRFVAVGVAAVTSAALVAGCSSGGSSGSSSSSTGAGGAPASGSTYTIGVLTSQTGGASQLGVEELNGAKLAVAKINAGGGVDGHKLVIKAADDQTNPQQALQQAKSLIGDKVAAIVGPSVVADCNAVTSLVKANGPVDYCLSPGITPSGYTFSSSVATQDLIHTALTYWKNKGITKIGMLYTTDASGTQLAEATQAAAKEVGVNVVGSASYDPTAVSATSELQKVMAGHPQALAAWSTGTPVGVALKAIQQAGVTLPVVTTDGNLANTFLKRAAAYMPKTLLIPATRDFWWTALPSSDPVKAMEKTYHQKYKNTYHEPPDFGAGVGYDAVMVIAKALGKSHSIDPAKMRSAIESIKGFDGVVGTYSFSAADHRGLGTKDVRMVKAANGAFTYVGK